MKLPLLLTCGALGGAQVLTLDITPIKLNHAQRAALARHVADTMPGKAFDWQTLEVHALKLERQRQPVTVKLSTLPVLTADGVCRSEQRHLEMRQASANAQPTWRSVDSLTRFHAWLPGDRDCATPRSPLSVSEALTDAEFLHLVHRADTLRSRAAQVIGGSDCARVRFCEVALGRIGRERQESPYRGTRIVTKLTFLPSVPGPSCLYVMELSFVGPLSDLVPLGASCPRP